MTGARTIKTYRELLAKLSTLSPEQLDQTVQVANDETSSEMHSVYIAEQDFFDFAERDYDEPCLPASELSGNETEVHVGIAKGTVTLLLDY